MTNQYRLVDLPMRHMNVQISVDGATAIFQARVTRTNLRALGGAWSVVEYHSLNLAELIDVLDAELTGLSQEV